MMRLVIAGEEPVTSFLDLGCGDGILAAALLEQYPNSKGVLLDFSEPMIRSAKTQLQKYGKNLVFEIVDYGKSSWIESVASTLPFDVVVSGFSIHHQPDGRKRQLYTEIHDLLRPGGLFVNIEHVSSPTKWIERVWDNYFIDSLYAVTLKEGSSKTRDNVAREFAMRLASGSRLCRRGSSSSTREPQPRFIAPPVPHAPGPTPSASKRKSRCPPARREYPSPCRVAMRLASGSRLCRRVT